MASLAYPQETEEFWLKHITAWQESDGTKSCYAKKYGLNYGRFLYWCVKLTQRKTGNQLFGAKPKLLPIKMAIDLQRQVLASIKIAGGYCIEIHETKVLEQLLKQRIANV
jgi:hypothetical protein